MFKINSGELRHTILIQRFTSTTIENIPTQTWTDLLRARAKILNVRGEEYYKAQSVGSKVSKTFYIRASKSLKITNKDRVIYDGGTYNILYVNDVEDRGYYLELKCEVKEC